MAEEIKTISFKGIRQVTFEQFNKDTASGTTGMSGYLWFVRNTDNDTADIYMGSKHYSHIRTNESGDTVDERVDAVEDRMDDVEEKLNGLLGEGGLGDLFDENGEWVGPMPEDDEHDIIGEASTLSEALEAIEKAILDEAERAAAAEAALQSAVDSIKLSYDKSGETKYIKLTGKDGKDLGKIDATDFIKDGMLESAELSVKSGSTYIVLTFNTEADSDPIELDVTNLVNVYTAGNGLKLEGGEFSIDEEVTATKVDINALQSELDTLNANLDAEVKLREQQKYAADQMFKGVVMYNVTSTANTISGVSIEYGHKIVLPAQDGAITGFINEAVDSEGNLDASNPSYANARGAQLLNLSKWNVVDVGSKQVDLSLNAKSRPTVEVVGGNEKMAYLSDIEGLLSGDDIG